MLGSSDSTSTRERVALQTKAESCAVCHEMINPLGFTLEHFDAVGRYRSEELGRSINAEGGYLTRSGVIQSVHAFGASPIGTFFLTFLILVTIFSGVLIFLYQAAAAVFINRTMSAGVLLQLLVLTMIATSAVAGAFATKCRTHSGESSA